MAKNTFNLKKNNNNNLPLFYFVYDSLVAEVIQLFHKLLCPATIVVGFNLGIIEAGPKRTSGYLVWLVSGPPLSVLAGIQSRNFLFMLKLKMKIISLSLLDN